MSTLTPSLSIVKGVPVVSSLQVAGHFEKPHDKVLRSIRSLIAASADCAANFVGTHTLVSMPTGGTRKSPAFNMTRDGFTLLAMGFTGRKALAWKIRYIEAFNAMEQALAAARDQGPKALPSPSEDPDLRELMHACDEAEHVALRLRQMFHPIFERLDRLGRSNGWPWPATCTQISYLKDDLCRQLGDNVSALRRICVVVNVSAAEGREAMGRDAAFGGSRFRR